MEDCNSLQQLFDDSSDIDSEMPQNYDLAYNLTTYLLIAADERNSSSILKATKPLEVAESSVFIIVKSLNASPPQDDRNDEEAAAGT